MSLKTPMRRFFLTAHVALSVSWLGSIAAFMALGIAGLVRAEHPEVFQAMYLSMDLIGWYVLVPLSAAALVTGLVQSLSTDWGLFRHYWVVAKFVLTVGATILLFVHMRAVDRAAALASASVLGQEFSALQIRLLVDGGLAAAVLLAATALSVYKPGGLTVYGWRKQVELARRAGRAWASPMSSAAVSMWPYALAVASLLILIAILHLTGVVGHH